MKSDTVRADAESDLTPQRIVLCDVLVELVTFPWFDNTISGTRGDESCR